MAGALIASDIVLSKVISDVSHTVHDGIARAGLTKIRDKEELTVE